MLDDKKHIDKKTKPDRLPLNWQDFKQSIRTLGKLAETSLLQHNKLEEDILEQGDTGNTGVKFSNFLQGFAILIVLVAIIAVAIYFTKNTDILTGLREEPLVSIPELDDPGDSSNEYTINELEAQDPIAITAHPWIFIRNEAVGNSFYAIYFESDGLCNTPSYPTIYYCGYTVNGSNVEIELYLTYTAEAVTDKGDVRSQVIDWKEWFHLTRTGNIMRGSYETESWFFSYEDGLDWRGKQLISDTVFAYPDLP